MVARCPKILSTYAGPRDEYRCNAINSREFNEMFRQDNQIFYQELSHMLGHLSFWVHAKAGAVTLCSKRTTYLTQKLTMLALTMKCWPAAPWFSPLTLVH